MTHERAASQCGHLTLTLETQQVTELVWDSKWVTWMDAAHHAAKDVESPRGLRAWRTLRIRLEGLTRLLGGAGHPNEDRATEACQVTWVKACPSQPSRSSKF